MGIYIRIDVDKPYGHKNIFSKILSKINEDYFKIHFNKPYLEGCKKLIKYLNEHNIQSNIYFRICTQPDKELKKMLIKGRHSIGLHAENTKNFHTFFKELRHFEKMSEININHFTKHGSGNFKLGKNHYAPYEPDKYKKWAKKLGLKYRFGNGTLINNINSTPFFHENMFWFEPWHKNSNFSDFKSVLNDAKKNDYVLLIHPANYETFSNIKKEFEEAINEIKKLNIDIKII